MNCSRLAQWRLSTLNRSKTTTTGLLVSRLGPLGRYSSSFVTRQTLQPGRSYTFTREMSDSAREFPVLARLLSRNKKWAEDLEKSHPGFFKSWQRASTHK